MLLFWKVTSCAPPAWRPAPACCGPPPPNGLAKLPPCAQLLWDLAASCLLARKVQAADPGGKAPLLETLPAGVTRRGCPNSRPHAGGLTNRAFFLARSGGCKSETHMLPGLFSSEAVPGLWPSLVRRHPFSPNVFMLSPLCAHLCLCPHVSFS